jgi:hypothetical protein
MSGKQAYSYGQILTILALIAVGLLSVATLGVDVSHIYWNKNCLQSGTEAAAQAGTQPLVVPRLWLGSTSRCRRPR